MKITKKVTNITKVTIIWYLCNYHTSHKGNYEKHIVINKHIKLIKIGANILNNGATFKKNIIKKYSCKYNLNKHRVK